MSARDTPRSSGGGTEVDGDCAVMDSRTDVVHSERQSVSQLVRNYTDPPTDGQKRDRSESGDPAPPAGKRGARERSGEPVRSPLTSGQGGRSFKEHLDTAIDDLESRITLSLSRDLHEFRQTLTAEIDKLNERVRDLERHVEDRDNVIDQLTGELRRSTEEVSALQTRVEDAEINSRLPCLVLSGSAVKPHPAPRLETPLPAQTAPAAPGRPPPGPAGRGQGQVVTSRPADRPAGGGERGPGGSVSTAGGGRPGSGGEPAVRSGGKEEREDINALVVTTLNRCMPGLNLDVTDIDRAHRLPGSGNRVIVRFVRSGQGSVRDQVMSRRLELRGKELYINESLTKLRSLIFRSLLAAKRERKIYTVYSRSGLVYFKERQHGVSVRVDSVQRVRELGYAVIER